MAAVQTGHELLSDRYRNKGTAFTNPERDRYRLHGLLPPVVESLETQLGRERIDYDAQHTDLGRHLFLRDLQERNSVLFYRLLSDHLEELLPIVYTPTVGLACQEWSKSYRRHHGLYVSWQDRDRIPELLANVIDGGVIDIIVVTDGERVLGLGDLGAGGMGIPIGKLALYTAVGGIDPQRTLPVLLDAGTENEALLSDELYLGWRHRRLRGTEYEELTDRFVAAVRALCPGVVLQWEDFAQANATRLLERHRHSICSFNDDIQGTAAVTVAAIVGGLRATGTPLRDLRLVIAGAGSAGTGIARQTVQALIAAGLPAAEAQRRCWLVDRDGLVHRGLPSLLDFQLDFAHATDDVAAWSTSGDGRVSLLDVVQRVQPHALVGVTGQPGLFTHDIVRAMAATVERPIIMPLSNPTVRAEAIPSDVVAWTSGRALIGTGSPFPPVPFGEHTIAIAQVNNLYLFPGLGRGAVAARAREITDGMLAAAATAIGSLTPVSADEPRLLPPLSATREVADVVAVAVARQAVADGVADERLAADPALLERRAATARWRPEYPPEYPNDFADD
ncbi:MAG: mez1 [Ilumatobacteraceae bacterium]|nr:mez1 [Ilumatobacteraceae bacterium]